jgi:hypothetical protein
MVAARMEREGRPRSTDRARWRGAARQPLALRAEAMNPDALSALARAYVMQRISRSVPVRSCWWRHNWGGAASVVQVWLVDQGVRQAVMILPCAAWMPCSGWGRLPIRSMP